MTRLTLHAVLAGFAISLGAAQAQAQGSDLVGSWRGTSTCVDRVNYPACRDEQVIYDAQQKGSSPDTVTVRADKLVNGEREFMGEFDFVRSADSTWVAEFRNERVHIRITLRVAGAELSGELTDQVSGRRVRAIAARRMTPDPRPAPGHPVPRPSR